LVGAPHRFGAAGEELGGSGVVGSGGGELGDDDVGSGCAGEFTGFGVGTDRGPAGLVFGVLEVRVVVRCVLVWPPFDWLPEPWLGVGFVAALPLAEDEARPAAAAAADCAACASCAPGIGGSVICGPAITLGAVAHAVAVSMTASTPTATRAIEATRLR
jgi:hypothetical protein